VRINYGHPAQARFEEALRTMVTLACALAARGA